MISRTLKTSLALIAALSVSQAGAASLYLSGPASGVAGNSLALDLVLDLEGATTLGGGVELSFTGPIAFGGFTPSAFFNSLNTDPSGNTDFTGYGDPAGPAAFEVFLGNGLDGFSGVNTLGTVAVSLLSNGVGSIGFAPSTTVGPFVTLENQTIPMSYQNGVGSLAVDVSTVVPLPGALWGLLSGVGIIGAARLRRR